MLDDRAARVMGDSGIPVNDMNLHVRSLIDMNGLERIEQALADVRSCVRDFDAMHHRLLALAEGLAERQLPHDEEQVSESVYVMF